MLGRLGDAAPGDGRTPEMQCISANQYTSSGLSGSRGRSPHQYQRPVSIFRFDSLSWPAKWV